MSNPGVSISATRLPYSSKTLDARIPWFPVVSRRDPLALLTNYSCNRWSLKYIGQIALFTVVFPALQRPITLDQGLAISDAMREIDHVRDKGRRFSNSSRGPAFSS